MLTQEYLKSIMTYDPNTGHMIRTKSKHKNKINQIVGSKMGDGYLSTRVLGKSYLLHRLAWLWVYGEFPKAIDHINGIRTDNRLSNIRLATPNENTMNHPLKSNNTSGYKNVTWHAVMGKWLACITCDKKKIRLGYFDDIEEANKVAIAARLKYHGQFANHGNGCIFAK